ncbi:MAG: glycosyltransferase, partial [Candidatus Pacebacteria bacterium]|nr:glycosyltransferase [Candidatus Paceibacterota bacterium]
SRKRIKVVVLVNQLNQRFAQNVNGGVKLASGELILLLNNDVKPQSNILKYLLPHFQKENMFAVGCLELEPNGVKGGKNKLWFERGMFHHARASDFNSGPTAWVSGGSGLFARDKWLELAGFDPDYAPAYWEDVDLSFRARKKGWQVWFEPKAVVEHHHESTNLAEFGQKKIAQISWQNAQQFVWKNGSLSQKLQHLLWQPWWWLKRTSSSASSTV